MYELKVFEEGVMEKEREDGREFMKGVNGGWGGVYMKDGECVVEVEVEYMGMRGDEEVGGMEEDGWVYGGMVFGGIGGDMFDEEVGGV